MERAVLNLPADVHTHRHGNPDAIYNAKPAEAMRLCGKDGNSQPYSLSLHPWDIGTDANGSLTCLGGFLDAAEVCMRDARMIAVGECGLDPKSLLSTEEQQAVFETLLDMARACGRPVIVHCVKLWDAMTESVARVWGKRQAAEAWDNGCPVIIHGFRKGPELARQLTGKGYRLSFGEHFNAEALQAVPATMRYAETDESELTIEEIKALQNRCISQI